MEGERVGTKRCRRKASRRMKRQRAEPRMGWGGVRWSGVGRGGEDRSSGSWESLPRPHFSDFLNTREIQGSLCGGAVCLLQHPGSDDAVDLVFKQWVCSLLGWGGVC